MAEQVKAIIRTDNLFVVKVANEDSIIVPATTENIDVTVSTGVTVPTTAISITASQVSDFAEAAQDAVNGSAMTDSSSIDFSYNDGANTWTGDVLPAGVDHDSLANYVAGQHTDWSQASAGTIHASNYVDNDTVYVYTHPNHTGDVTSTGDGATVIASNAVDGTKLRLANNEYLRGRNVAGTADLNILKINTLNELEIGYSAGPTILLDTSGFVSVNTTSRYLNDSSNALSVSWNSRELYDLNGDAPFNWSTPDVIKFIGSSTAALSVQFFDLDSSNYIGIKSPNVVSANYTLTLPPTTGTVGQSLITDGAGITSWSTLTPAAIGSPALVNPSTDNAIVRFDGTAGLQQNSAVTIDDSSILTTPGAIDITQTLDLDRPALRVYAGLNTVQDIVQVYDWNDDKRANITWQGYLQLAPYHETTGRALEITLAAGTNFNPKQMGIRITSTATGTIPEHYGIEVDMTGNSGTINRSRCINANFYDNGGVSYGFVSTQTGQSGRNFAAFSSATGGPSLYYAKNTGATTGTLFKGENSIAGFTGSAIDITLDATSDTGSFIKFSRLNSGSQTGERFRVDGLGNIYTNSGVVLPRGTIGTYGNLVKYSEDISNSSWVKTGCSVGSNVSNTPDGQLLKADKITQTSGVPSATQLMSGVVTASKTFIVQGWVKTYISGFPNIRAWLNSGNESGTVNQISSLSFKDEWKYFIFTQTFTGASTPNLTVGFGEVGSFGIVFDLWGVTVAESSSVVGYSATSNHAVALSRGASVNGSLVLSSNKGPTRIQIISSAAQGTTNSFEQLQVDGVTKNVWITPAGNLTVLGTVAIGDEATTMTISGVAESTNLFAHALSGKSVMLGESHSDTASKGAFMHLGRSRGTTEATSAVVQNGDTLFGIGGLGYDGTDYEFGGYIHLDVQEATPGPAAMGSKWTFATAPAGSITPALAMTIDCNQNSIFSGQAELMAGTATKAPLKLNPGTNLTTPAAGRVEYDGKILYFTKVATRRRVMVGDDAIVADTTVVNTVTETELFSATLGANSLSIADVLRTVCSGYYSTANASDTFTLRLKIGGTTVVTATSIAANVTDAPWHTEMFSTVRTIGGSGTVVSHATVDSNNAGSDTSPTAATSIDTTTSNTLSITVEWSSANVGNTLTINQGFTTFI